MMRRFLAPLLFAVGCLLAGGSTPAYSDVREVSREVLEQNHRDIGAEAYRVDAYLRLYDQRNRLLILAGTMDATDADGALADAGQAVFTSGVDDALVQSLLALHEDAFSQFLATLERIVTSDNGRAKLSRARPSYNRMISGRIDPLPLLIQLNFLWAEETGNAWPGADRFSSFAMRVRAVIPDSNIRDALAQVEQNHVSEARAQTGRQHFAGATNVASVSSNSLPSSSDPLVSSSDNSHVFSFGGDSIEQPSSDLDPREFDTMWRSSSGSFAFPPLQDGAMEVIALGGNELLIGEFKGNRFTGHWIQVAVFGDPICGQEMRGSRIWGRIEIEFTSVFDSFEGRSGECDSTNLDFTWTANRTQ